MCEIPNGPDARFFFKHLLKILELSEINPIERLAIEQFIEKNCNNPEFNSAACPYRDKNCCQRFPCEMILARSNADSIMFDPSGLWNLAFYICVEPSSAKCMPLAQSYLEDPDPDVTEILISGIEQKINKRHTAEILQIVVSRR